MTTSPDIVIVGPIAPPRGGISTHVERLVRVLQREGLRVGILDHFAHDRHPLAIATLRRNPLRYWWEMRRLRAPVVHYHHARWSTLIAASLAGRRHNGAWVVTFHGHSLSPFLRSPVPGVAMLTRWAVRRFDRIIAVSDAVAHEVRERTGAEVTVVPAYLPADAAETDGGANSPPTVIVAAYRVGRTPGEDLYGIDIAGAIYASACAVIPDLCLKLFLSQAPGGSAASRYLERALAPAYRAGAPERVSVYVDAELVPAFRPGTVYLRTTRTDGDAVSVREALDAGVPVIASDVVERPAGVSTVSLEAVDAWVTALREALERDSLGSSDRLQPSLEHARAIVSLYRELIAQLRDPPAPITSAPIAHA